MFRTKVIEKIETRILYSVTFSQYRAVYGIMWKKNGTARQATDDSIAHAHCMLHT